MKKLITSIFFLFSNLTYTLEKMYFTAPVIPRINAMGSTGMIFGKEHGAFLCAPTSILNTEESFAFNLLNIGFQLNSNSNFLSFFPYMRISASYINEHSVKKSTSAVLGHNITFQAYKNQNSESLEFQILNYTHLIYAFGNEVFGIGIGAKVFYTIPEYLLKPFNKYSSVSFPGNVFFSRNEEEDKILIFLFKGFSFDLSWIICNEFLGNFSASANNLFSLLYHSITKESLKGHKEKNINLNLRDAENLMKSLVKLGYGKEFHFELCDIKLAVELGSFLYENNQYRADEIKIGSEFSFLLKGVGLDLRVGLSNSIPTAGAGINFSNIFELNYSFSGIKILEKNRFSHHLSISLGYF